MALRFPWETETDPSESPITPAPDMPPRLPKPRGRRPSRAAQMSAPALSTSIWLYHHLTIKGPANDLAAFAAAAQGPGIIPWQIDGTAIEEDIFIRAVSQPGGQRSLTVAGCRILARQFRERIEAREARARDRIGVSRACPFDLQVLVPIPASILSLGHTHPTALSWLAQHWGITDPPRQIVVRPAAGPGRRQKSGHGVIGYGFFTAATSPTAAISTIAQRWPALKFQLLPISTD
ncbi:hypothetical protein [Acidiphilium acidophilum]|uniref:hypothetical protein n=1 Tax=Acidiphilium acidophilum TaxID=76588 RepID=UPI002E8E64E5|nr:hypothetical protein [Acidiphilium acidophilum]